MAHPPHTSEQGQIADDKTSRLIVIFSLLLFFTMSLAGHYVFVLNPADTGNHAVAPAHDTR